MRIEYAYGRNSSQETRAALDGHTQLILTKPLNTSQGELHKLIPAIEQFKPILEGKTALGISASTGGFTDVLLKHGVNKVYAVDVGTDQLHPSCR